MDQQEIDKLLEQMVLNAEKDIDRVFAKRLKWLLERIAQMYQKYATGGQLTWTDVNGYGRYQKEMALMATEISSDYSYLLKNIQSLLQNTYLENYLRSAFLFEVTAQKLMGFSVPTVQTVKDAVINPIPKLTLPALLEEHRNEIVRKIDIEMSQGLMTGEDYSKMANRIQNTVGFSQAKARRVARTEAGRVQTISRNDSAAQTSKYADLVSVWLATLDERTRLSHRELDGKEADQDGYFHYHGMKAKGPHLWGVASMDINCRCVTIYKVNGIIPDNRRARNYEDPDYQQKLADKVDELIANGMTQKQAEKQAKKEISAPNVVVPWQTYEDYRKNRFN